MHILSIHFLIAFIGGMATSLTVGFVAPDAGFWRHGAATISLAMVVVCAIALARI